MLVSFSFENWMSFRDSVSFSMVASRERQHGERVPRVPKYQVGLLPVTAIYGANGSGKTNFFKALNFVRLLVVRGTVQDGRICVEPYQLDRASVDKPSRFKLELLIDETIHEFSFAVTPSAVVEEKLIRVTSSNEKTLYHRQDNRLKVHPSLERNQFLHYAFSGTRDNQLFLTNSVSQNIELFRPVHDWFKDVLDMIAPDGRFGLFEHVLDEIDPLYNNMGEMLSHLDTGISRLGEMEIPLNRLGYPEKFIVDLQENVKEGANLRLYDPLTNERYIITRKSRELVAKKLIAFHMRSDGTYAEFNLRQESEGIQRAIDLLPAFLGVMATDSRKVIVVDEIDRCLHSLLTRKLIAGYLVNCSRKSRAQLLMSTQDLLLMDQGIFRRDEMWVTERDQEGSSTLYSFSDFKDVRYDKEVRKSYLQGRLGGVPRFLLSN